MASEVVFVVGGRNYRMGAAALALFKYVQENRVNPQWQWMQGCDACGTVCFTECLCRCKGHIDRRSRDDDDYGNHKPVASIAEVRAAIQRSRESVA